MEMVPSPERFLSAALTKVSNARRKSSTSTCLETLFVVLEEVVDVRRLGIHKLLLTKRKQPFSHLYRPHSGRANFRGVLLPSFCRAEIDNIRKAHDRR